jgi:hypothetical protein
MAWAHGAAGSGKHIYWLSGVEGTGKLTITSTFARHCYNECCLSASFLFARGASKLATACKFVMTILLQLAQQALALQKLICAVLHADTYIANTALSDQWQQLVLHLFAQLAAVLAAVDDGRQSAALLVIVVDRIDQCGDNVEIAFRLELLQQAADIAAYGLRVFLTSWPEVPICSSIAHTPKAQQRHLVLHCIALTLIDSDL